MIEHNMPSGPRGVTVPCDGILSQFTRREQWLRNELKDPTC